MLALEYMIAQTWPHDACESIGVGCRKCEWPPAEGRQEVRGAKGLNQGNWFFISTLQTVALWPNAPPPPACVLARTKHHAPTQSHIQAVIEDIMSIAAYGYAVLLFFGGRLSSPKMPGKLAPRPAGSRVFE